MKRLQSRLLAELLLVSVIAGTTTVHAADDPNVQQMKRLFTKIGQTLGVGSNDPLVGDSFLTLANPGILLDPTLKMAKPEDRRTLYRLLDKTLFPDWVMKQSNDFTLDVYDKVLTFKEVPIIKPNAQQQAELDAARKLIYSDGSYTKYSKLFDEYRKTRTALSVATKNMETWRRANLDPTTDAPPDLVDELDKANEDFKLLGKKNEIAAAKDKIDMYENLDPSVWWGGLRDRFQSNTETLGGNRFPSFDLYPRYENWLDPKRSWTTMTITQSDLEQTVESHHTETGGGFGVSWGMWSVGGECNNTTDTHNEKSNLQDLKITFDVTTVDIVRPWMDTAVFKIPTWRWLYGSPPFKTLISDGADAASGKTPSGTMPFLPTSLLLARNVRLGASAESKLLDTFHSLTQCNASVGWGPFRLSGRRNQEDSKSYVKANDAGTGVEFDAPQLIGMFVEVLPLSPHPDPSLPFPPKPADVKLNTQFDAALESRANSLLTQSIKFQQLNMKIKGLDAAKPK